jgi:hypothetical protein
VGGDLVLVKYEGAVEALFKIAAEETDGLAVVSCSASKEVYMYGFEPDENEWQFAPA